MGDGGLGACFVLLHYSTAAQQDNERRDVQSSAITTSRPMTKSSGQTGWREAATAIRHGASGGGLGSRGLMPNIVSRPTSSRGLASGWSGAGERGMCEGRKGQGRVTSQRGQEAVDVHSREGKGGVGVEVEVMVGGLPGRGWRLGREGLEALTVASP
jgi:hypothetical protein